MVDNASVQRWRDAALSGRFERVEGVMQEMLGRYWPEHEGRMFVQQYDLPNPHKRDTEEYMLVFNRQSEEMADRYGTFVRQLYTKSIHQPGDDLQNNLQRLTSQASMQSERYFANGADSDTFGFMKEKWFNFNRAGDPTHYDSFKVAAIGISANGCPHCKTSLDARSDARSCQLVTPDMVFHDRMQYFGTAMHELAHAVRELDGNLKYDTPEERRYEETVARTFQGLMVARTFGAAGYLQLRMDASEIMRNDRGSANLRWRYEALGPLSAAIDYVGSNRAEFERMSPRQLLSLSEQLVEQHDPTRKMTPEERDYYRTSISNLSLQFNDLAESVGDWRKVTALSPEQMDKSVPGSSQLLTLFQAQARLEEAALQRQVVLSSLENAQLRLNPLRPPALRRIDQHVENIDDPAQAEALRAFNAAHNPSFCPPLQAVSPPSPTPETAPAFKVPVQPPAPPASPSKPAVKPE